VLRAAASRLASAIAHVPVSLVDEMKPGAGETGHGHTEIGIGLISQRGRRKPVLHVHAGPRALEKDKPAIDGNMQRLRSG